MLTPPEGDDPLWHDLQLPSMIGFTLMANVTFVVSQSPESSG
jgi:hypothetical protein